MFTSLKGGPLWASVAVVISVLGSATALVIHGNLSGSDWLAVATPVLSGAAAIGGAHVVANAAAAGQGSITGAGVPENGPPAPASVVGTSAMPPPN